MVFTKRNTHIEGMAETFYVQALLQSKSIALELRAMKRQKEESPENIASKK